jgi:hypothetical protein
MRKIIAAIILAGSAALGIAACGSSHPAATPKASHSAPATPDLATRYSAWYGTTGTQVNTVLLTDTGKLSDDLSQYDEIEIMADGALLATDAGNALNQPVPPVDPADWRDSLKLAVRAGNALAQGDYTGGAAMLSASTSKLNTFVTAVSTAG